MLKVNDDKPLVLLLFYFLFIALFVGIVHFLLTVSTINICSIVQSDVHRGLRFWVYPNFGGKGVLSGTRIMPCM